MPRLTRSRPAPAPGRGERSRLRAVHLLILLVLLIAPAWALWKLAAVVELWLVFSVPAVVSLISYVLYAVDKRRAEAGAWRTPESVLHFSELLGGWPGAWIAQRRLRHKTRKVSYQVMFWLIVAAHQVLAIGYVRDWNWTI